MINFWYSLAWLYGLIMVIGLVWALNSEPTMDKSIRRLEIECNLMKALGLIWVACMIVFPILIVLGVGAENGEIWGLIPIR